MTRSLTIKIITKEQNRAWLNDTINSFVVRVDFMLVMTLRKLKFTILPILKTYDPKSLASLLKLGMTNYHWILGKTFGKQIHKLCNGSKTNAIKFKFVILSDTPIFPG